MKRKGIILAGGLGSRLYPVTIPVSKQLLPIYDKPMIYYPLSVLMLAGIREVLIISRPQDLSLFKKLFEDGHWLGMRFAYKAQPKPEGLAQALLLAEEFLDGSPSCLILGDNLFYSRDLKPTLREADERRSGATIFGYHVANPQDYGVIEFSKDGRLLSIEEKPANPKSHYAVPGIYFYDAKAPQLAAQLKPSARGEIEITDLNRLYLEHDELHVQLFGRGTAWLDTGTHDSLLDAANFVHAIQKRQALKIAAVEEIALEEGWITPEILAARADSLGKTEYADYLRSRLVAP